MKTNLKIKHKGTTQTSGMWLIPSVLGYSKTNLNYEADVYTIHLFVLIQFSFIWKRKIVIPDGSDIVELARYWAYKWHRSTNHYYGKDGNEVPYEYHLEMVEAEAHRWMHLLPDGRTRKLVIAGCLVHDTIEDARVTLNDVKQALGSEIAEFAYALSNEKGRNRKQRANEKYYAGIRALKYATYIKVCDRLANVRYSLSPDGGRMADGYRKENADFKKELYDPRFSEMFDELDKLLA